MALHAYTPPLHAVKTSQPHVALRRIINTKIVNYSWVTKFLNVFHAKVRYLANIHGGVDALWE